MSKLNYIINGKDFKEFNVFVSDSEGLIDRPKTKKPLSFSWDNYHGNTVDLSQKYYESREITLVCFIIANGYLDFVTKVQAFEQMFDKPGTLRLSVSIDEEKPLLYEVYCEDSITIKKKWNDKQMIGTFSLKLNEPEPVKRVYKFTRTEVSKSCTLSIESDKLFNIYWGDETSDFDISDNPILHEYKNTGDYFIVIAGDIDSIKNISINATLVWNKL